jgi:hypothetical protein
MSLLIWKGPTNALVETSESGTLAASDRIRWTQVFKGIYWICRVNQPARGAFGSGVTAGWVCNQSSVTMERGQIGKLTIEWEAGGAYAKATLPVGDFSMEPQELYPRIERNAFFVNLTPDNIKLACNAVYLSIQDDALGINNNSFKTKLDALTGIQLTLGEALYTKKMRGEETFYITGWRYSYEEFSYMPIIPSSGGFTGTPGGPMSGYLPSNVVWLRLADHPQPAGVNGSMYKNTINWLGGPLNDGVGFWDPDLYPPG